MQHDVGRQDTSATAWRVQMESRSSQRTSPVHGNDAVASFKHDQGIDLELDQPVAKVRSERTDA